MSLLVLLVSLMMLNVSLNVSAMMYVDDNYYTRVRTLFDDDDSDSDDDYDRQCGILNCDECSYNNTCYVCNSGFYLSETNTECIQCEDTHCYRCIGSGMNMCNGCYDNYILYNYSCVSRFDFPREHLINECEAYNVDYKCILCDDDCTLESNGKCNCNETNTAVIVVSVVIPIILVIAIVIVVLICIRRKKQNKTKQTTTATTTPEQVVPIQEKFAKQYSINNNACEAKPAIMDHNRGSSNSNLVCECEDNNNSNNNKVLCSECNKDYAMYKLSCGCCFCVNHVGCFKEFPCEKNICSRCNKEVLHVNKLGSM